MEIFKELFGVSGIAGALGATILYILKTIISYFVKKKEKQTENNIEFKSHKQKALFDIRFNTYSEIYSKIKELEGTIKTFENVYWIAGTRMESAFYSKVNMQYFEGLSTEELNEIKMIYDVNPDGRCIINFNHFLELMSERKLDLNNYVAKEERILKEEESLLFKELFEKADELIEKIGQSFNKAYNEVDANEQEPINKCNSLVLKLDSYLKEYFTNDLSNLNDIIRDIDNKFREDIHG
ncbi:hypothetical protein [Jeotgalicoccus sp. FSL K6-3177]|uniref:hypothetical protein n=1 Tax=Jeotgalicoccus sp. FSL K6-3177 TaxID=2921494 RepID=UPI0030FDCB06